MRNPILRSHFRGVGAGGADQAVVDLERRESGAGAFGVGHVEQLTLGLNVILGRISSRIGSRNLLLRRRRTARGRIRRRFGHSSARCQMKRNHEDEGPEHAVLPTFQTLGETALLGKEYLLESS